MYLLFDRVARSDGKILVRGHDVRTECFAVKLVGFAFYTQISMFSGLPRFGDCFLL